MASVTLAESAKLALDELVAGVIEDIITVNQIYTLMPFQGIEGNSLAYNRENALGDVITATVDTTFTSAGAGRNPATFTKVNSNLTTIMGNADVNGMIQATRSGDGNDQTAIQIASKAKSCGRQYQDMMINGTGAGTTFPGLLSLVDASQTIAAATDGTTLTFELLDSLIDSVTDKDGMVDFLMMHSRTRRSYRSLLRALGGASITEVVELPGGGEIMAYNGIPIFRNDWIPTNQTQGNTNTCTTVIAGNFDDGSQTHGIAGITAMNAAGIQVVDVGEAEDADNHIWRVKWYCGLANFSRRGLSILKGITN